MIPATDVIFCNKLLRPKMSVLSAVFENCAVAITGWYNEFHVEYHVVLFAEHIW